MFYDRTRKSRPFNTGDCIIEVTTWPGLTVCSLARSLGRDYIPYHCQDLSVIEWIRLGID